MEGDENRLIKMSEEQYDVHDRDKLMRQAMNLLSTGHKT